ncbi:adenylate kinase [Acutalibacter sp. 1XD8-33]|uniref:adenylate kinase n=1 Tax=Acutalibacter sp. 1XD8-33 TaxID=2320081 RepID=UPI000EA27DA8|nr:adenylate kinase [Acutalibacter sp. 1XD8-33]RKJ40582.1 adenylate kinase [Acutalibacter sp. 1XD8-33]
MVLLIAGTTHTGKTALAQRLLEKYHYPYLSIDHLKMGLIRSGQTELTPEDDPELTEYLWPIVREMVKTAVENRQNLIVEGCYIPFCWKEDFGQEYLREIRYVCLVMTRRYIEGHRADILGYAGVVEERLEDSLDWEALIRENEENLRRCREKGLEYLLIDGSYQVELEL